MFHGWGRLVAVREAMPIPKAMAQPATENPTAAVLHIRDRVDHLRISAIELLDHMVGEGFAADSVLSGAVAELQNAVTRLAAAETGLSAWHDLGEVNGVPGQAELATEPSPSQEAAIVLALASTTVPSATSPVDEAERWLRVLRSHGRVGAALEELGVAVAPLETTADLPLRGAEGSRHEGTDVAEVAQRAARIARARRSATLDTLDVLAAVMDVHRGRFERALYARGTTMKDLLERLPDAERVPTQA
jgi:hypothetical protein